MFISCVTFVMSLWQIVDWFWWLTSWSDIIWASISTDIIYETSLMCLTLNFLLTIPIHFMQRKIKFHWRLTSFVNVTVGCLRWIHFIVVPLVSGEANKPKIKCLNRQTNNKTLLGESFIFSSLSSQFSLRQKSNRRSNRFVCKIEGIFNFAMRSAA